MNNIHKYSCANDNCNKTVTTNSMVFCSICGEALCQKCCKYENEYCYQEHLICKECNDDDPSNCDICDYREGSGDDWKSIFTS